MKAGQANIQFRSEINITPLVDVVLVLLITFMIVTPLLQRGYEVAIPRNGRVQPEPSPEKIIVSFTSRNEIFLNKEKINAESLAARLVGLLKGRRDKTVFLSAQDEANYGQALRVVDAIRNAGGKVGIVPGDPLPMR